ncbi:MAG: chlororespiratory reduction protein 7 [Coleofasciculaceae cyanobacterium SM2_3_26]|nr:chlororespiratory reduction protein 7 [Coleofasciculaceae cyanobacterium SM2_3_26]
MPDSLMYQNDGFVVLEPNQPEQLLSSEEMLAKLQSFLATQQEDLPRDLQKFASVAEQAAFALENYCELNTTDGQFLQWYAVRMEK